MTRLYGKSRLPGVSRLSGMRRLQSGMSRLSKEKMSRLSKVGIIWVSQVELGKLSRYVKAVRNE